MRYVPLALIAVLCLGFAVPDPLVDFGGWVDALVKGFGARDWLIVGGLAVLGLTALVRWQRSWLVKKVPFFGGQAGGYVLGFGIAALTSLAGGLVGHVAWLEVVKQALIQGFLASGLWQALKDFKGG